MATIDVKDASGATIALEKPLTPGRKAATLSRPVVLSNEDLAALSNPTPLHVRITAAGTTNATSVKGSGGRVFAIHLHNSAAYEVFLKLYNKATAPTVGTDTPIRTIRIKAGADYTFEDGWGLPMTTGIAYAITKLYADADVTVVVADDLYGGLLYS